MSTARDLISGSLRALGALATGETVQASEANDALVVLNELLDSWSNESLLVFNRAAESFSLVAGTGSYTIGDGATFDTLRPQRIENAFIKDDNNYEQVLEIIGKDDYANIALKNTTSDLPMYLYPENTYPNMTLRLWPVPSAAYTLVLYNWSPLTQITNLSTTLSLPPGYLRALRYNLAIELAPEYGKEPLPTLVRNAMEAKTNIKRMNIVERILSCDPAVLSRGGGYDWRIGK